MFNLYPGITFLSFKSPNVQNMSPLHLLSTEAFTFKALYQLNLPGWP